MAQTLYHNHDAFAESSLHSPRSVPKNTRY